MSTPQVQGLIRKQTALGGRHNRGRIFIPDIAETQTNEVGELDATGIGLLQAIADAWFDDVPTIDGVAGLVVLHTHHLPAPTTITATTAEGMVATLRGRFDR
jgi:hypothetical protein